MGISDPSFRQRETSAERGPKRALAKFAGVFGVLVTLLITMVHGVSARPVVVATVPVGFTPTHVAVNPTTTPPACRPFTRDPNATHYEIVGPATDGRQVAVVCRIKETGKLLFITTYALE